MSESLIQELIIQYYQAVPVQRLTLFRDEVWGSITDYRAFQEEVVCKLLRPSTEATLTWPFGTHRGLDGDREIYDDAVVFAGQTLTPVLPSPPYQQAYLKALIAKLEAGGMEIHDEILSLYVRHLTNRLADGTDKLARLGVTEVLYRRYFLTDDLDLTRSILLMESKAMVASGTTGLRTWQASLMLGHYLLNHPELVAGRTVLELGAGVGFLGVLASTLNPSRLTLTDSNASVLRRLALNVGLNAPLNPSVKVAVRRWDWAEVTEAMIADAEPNLVLGADVAYDPEGIDRLVDLLARFACQAQIGFTGGKMLVACTVRNSVTFSHLLTRLDAMPGLTYTTVDLSGERSVLVGCGRVARFYYEDTVSVVKLICIEPVQL